ncbi:MAG: hypothetical protein NVS2B14_00890 [Chamaesiphon sp.]
MTFFENFTSALKQKWIEYFQVNRSWISLQMKVTAVKTPDGGMRPTSYFILGSINALEPKLGTLMLPFYQLNSDADKLVDILGLNFDPDMELAKLSGKNKIKAQDAEASRLLPNS